MAAGLLSAAVAETGLVLWRDLTQEKKLPPPSDFVAVAIVYGGLSLFPDSASRFTALVGWGLVLATFLNLWSPQKPTKLAVGGGKTATSAGQGAPLTVKQGAAA